MTEPMTTVPVQPVVRTSRPGSRAANVLLLVACLVAAAGVAFAVGRATAPAAPATFDPAGAGAGDAPNASFVPGAGGPGGMGGSMTLTGTVTAVDGTTLTITTADGRVVTVDTSGASYHSQAAAAASDVTAGDTVQVATAGPGMAAGGPNASVAPGSATGGGTTTATDVTIVSGS